MKLYLFERTKDVGYDEFDGAVILAEDEEEALRLASRICWEGSNFGPSTYCSWFENNENGYHFTEICEIVGKQKSQVLLESFNAG